MRSQGLSKRYWAAEPLRKKLRRWLLGERNLPPESITEQFPSTAVKAALPTPNNERLAAAFQHFDRELFFGVGFCFVARVYKAMGLPLDATQKRELYRASGYSRKLNQQGCSMTLRELADELLRRFGQISVQDKTANHDESGSVMHVFASFEEFVEAFLAAAENSLSTVS